MVELLSKIVSTLTAITMALGSGVSILPNTQLAALPLTNGLVAYWNMNEASGAQVTDSSGNNFTGSILNNASLDTAGRDGNAIQLNGTNQYISVANNSNIQLANTPYTVSLWIKHNDPNAATNSRGILSKFDGSGLLFAFLNGKPYINHSGATSAQISSNTSLAQGSWYHLAVVYDRTNLSLYINGSLDSSRALSSDLTGNTAPLEIGNFNGNYFLGSIDDVALYSRALSSSEISSLFNNVGGSTPASTPEPTPTPTPAPVTPTPEVDTIVPTISITAPTSGSTVSGSVNMTATASDNVGVIGVQFYDNGVAIGVEDTASPYSVTWNTSSVENGSHSLTARARDLAGNTNTSSAILVNVNNIVATLVIPTSTTGEWYVSPNGSASGNGSMSNPWDLQTALNQTSVVRPGHTVWLRGGTYRGKFISNLNGTSQSPIIIRNYQGERAILDFAGPISTTAQMTPGLGILGSYNWVWGLELMDSGTQRIHDSSLCWENQHCRAGGASGFGAGTKFINLVVHDTGDGISLFNTENAESYGNIVFNNGWQNQSRGNGHSSYAQNRNAGSQINITDNIFFHSFHSGLHGYGSSDANIRNIILEGNIIFRNGLLASDPNGWGVLIGGNATAENNIIRNNYLYNPTNYTRSSNINPSYSRSTSGTIVTGNYSYGYSPIAFDQPMTGAYQVTGNTFVGGNVLGNTSGQVSATTNTVQSSGSGLSNAVFVRPNRYEQGRAHIAVFNHQGLSSATVNLSSSGLVNGDVFEIRDVQNYFGTPVYTGTYNSASPTVSLPMNLTAVTPTIGIVPNPPQHSSSEFNAFVVRKTSTSSSTSAPAPAPIPASIRFSTGQRVQTTSNLNVRSTASASGSLLGTQSLGALGTIISGGQSVDGYYWWNINFDSGVDGYSIENYLANYTAPSTTSNTTTTSTTSTTAPTQTTTTTTSATQTTTTATTTTVSKVYIEYITLNLKKGSSGVQVGYLQQALIIEGLLLPKYKTNYFGSITETALKAFQKKYGIVSSGTPKTTGYGSTGPITRSKLNEVLNR